MLHDKSTAAYDTQLAPFAERKIPGTEFTLSPSGGRSDQHDSSGELAISARY